MDLGSKSFSIVAVPPAVLHLSSSRIFIPRALGSIRAALGRRGTDQSHALLLAAVIRRMAVGATCQACHALGVASHPRCAFLCAGPASLDDTQLFRNGRPLLRQIKLWRGVLAGEQSGGKGHLHPSASSHEELSRV